jgi:hypothetical protein
MYSTMQLNKAATNTFVTECLQSRTSTHTNLNALYAKLFFLQAAMVPTMLVEGDWHSAFIHSGVSRTFWLAASKNKQGILHP